MISRREILSRSPGRTDRRNLGAALCGLVLMFCAAGPSMAEHSDDERALLALHQQLLQVHLDHNLQAWLEMEAEEFVSANGGEISQPSKDERRSQRQAYLDLVRFDEYRDMRPPIVRVSDDGTLGWVIVQVAVSGTLPDRDGRRQPFSDQFAWVELYARQEGGWQLVGNASNRR